MKMVSETQAHRSEIDDIEFSPDGGKVFLLLAKLVFMISVICNCDCLSVKF